MNQQTLIPAALPPAIGSRAAAAEPGAACVPSTRGQAVQYGAGYVIFAAGRVLRDLAVARILGHRVSACGRASGVPAIFELQRLRFHQRPGPHPPPVHRGGKNWRGSAGDGHGMVMAMAGTLVFALALASKFLASFRSHSPVWGWGMTTVIILMFIDKQYMYSSVAFRSADGVGESGVWMGLLGGLELGLGVWLTREYGLYGLLYFQFFWLSLVL